LKLIVAMNELSLILLLRLTAGTAAFSSGFERCTRQTTSRHRTTSCLQDSLFSELFEDNSNEGSTDEAEEVVLRQDTLPPKNYNDDAPPFSEFEKPQDRARRMEMARELQKAFYKEPTAATSSTASSTATVRPPAATATISANNASYGSAALRNLPTITTGDGIKSADESSLLPGYQFVWHVHNPQHCHMFHSILSGPAPWHFAHVHLPSSSYASESSEEEDDDEKPIDHVQSYSDIQGELKAGGPLYGTLLRITDRRFQDEDGRIVLAVQAIDRIRIDSVASVPGTYLCTDAQLSPEDELMRMYFDKALLSSASYLSSHSSDDASEDYDSEALSCPLAVSGAARAAASADTTRVRRFEYLPIFLEEKPKRPSSANTLRAKPEDSNATKKIKDAIHKQGNAKKEEISGPDYIPVVQLVNYDAFAYSSLGNSDLVTSQALKTYWGQLAKEKAVDSSSIGSNSEQEDLFGSSSADTPSFFLPEPSSSLSGPHRSAEAVEVMEYHIWRALDEMIRLLSMATASTVPLPSQLLGLLPERSDWPHEFALEDYAKSLSSSRSTIGTAFKSPFVHVDHIASSDPSAYSKLRRAQRLSYAIWLLLDGLVMANAQPPPPPRSEILKMESIEQRLGAAKETLEGINAVLKKMIPENRKDGDEKK